VPFRTSPFDMRVHHNLTLAPSSTVKSTPQRYSQKTASENIQCPLQFTLGLSRRSHTSTHSIKSLSIVQPPVIYPVFFSRGPGRQVLHTTLYEHLDLLTPTLQEGLQQEPDYPLLFESSSFAYSYPILHDVNGDGVMDAIVADYDGGIYFVELKSGASHLFHKAQVPRLYLRRDWMIHRLNETVVHGQSKVDTEDDPFNPYHSHFEYYHSGEKEQVLQGVSANVLKQEHEDAVSLSERRRRRVKHEQEEISEEEEEAGTHEQHPHRGDPDYQEEDFHLDRRQEEEEFHEQEQPQAVKKADETVEQKQEQRIEQEQPQAAGNQTEGTGTKEQVVEEPHRRLQEVTDSEGAENQQEQVKDNASEPHEEDVVANAAHEGAQKEVHDPVDHFDHHDEHESDRVREFDDDFALESFDSGEEEDNDHEDMDDAGPSPGHDDYAYGYDDYYYAKHNEAYDDYYDDKHYVRVPPHLLCNPVLAEMPKQYGGNEYEMDDMLFVAVSYYLDEDEYEGFFSYKRFENTDRGDETEVQRGMYVANALMVYNIGDYFRWGRQEQLELSGDATAPQNSTLVGSYPIVSHEAKMGAFALSSPTIADIDGDGTYDVLMGTSLGVVYAFDARNLFSRDGWPVQMKHAVESRILVEDVLGDTNLEMFVVDIGGNVVCLDRKGSVLWSRDLRSSLENEKAAEVLGSSSMSLGDVDGDGRLDLVMALKIDSIKSGEMFYIVAISAVDGSDIKNFPIAVESKKYTNEGDKEVHLKLPQPLLVDLHADQSGWNTVLNLNTTRSEKRKEASKSGKPPHGGSAKGLHVVQPIGSELFIVEAGSGCIQAIAIGDEVAAMVQADDVHGTGRIDLVISTASGKIVTLESPAVPYHPLNVWNNGETRGRRNALAQGYSASQGIFVHSVSRRYRDIFGVYVPVTFEIFDKRPSIDNEPTKRVYKVEFRDGTSSKRSLGRNVYNSTGVYTERLYIPYGPGYYSISAVLKTTHGLMYEDTFHIGYNVHFMDGFGMLLWLPLVLAAIPIIFCGRKKLNWDDEDFDDGARGDRGLGILGRSFSSSA